MTSCGFGSYGSDFGLPPAICDSSWCSGSRNVSWFRGGRGDALLAAPDVHISWGMDLFRRAWNRAVHVCLGVAFRKLVTPMAPERRNPENPESASAASRFPPPPLASENHVWAVYSRQGMDKENIERCGLRLDRRGCSVSPGKTTRCSEAREKMKPEGQRLETLYIALNDLAEMYEQEEETIHGSRPCDSMLANDGRVHGDAERGAPDPFCTACCWRGSRSEVLIASRPQTRA